MIENVISRHPAVVDWDKQCQVFKQQVEGVLNRSLIHI